MSTTVAFAAVGYVVVASLFGTGLLVLRARRRESAAARVVREAQVRQWDADGQRWATVHEVGPDGLRLLDELSAHLKAYAATVADLYVAPADTDHTTKGDL